jgi:hypothetical protein
MTTKIEILSDEQLGIDAKGLRKRKIEQLATMTAATTNTLWHVGVRGMAFRLSGALSRTEMARRQVHFDAQAKSAGRRHNLETARAEYTRLQAEVAAMTTQAKSLHQPLLAAVGVARDQVKEILVYAESLKVEDGELDCLIDWRVQDQLHSLAGNIKDCIETQQREYAMMMGKIKE